MNPAALAQQGERNTMEQGSTTGEKQSTFARKAGRVLIWFFAAMFALTFLSRAASDALKARVSVGYTSAASLDEGVNGTGKWESGETQFYTTYYTRRISKVYVKPGQTIALGDPLFAYDVATVGGGKKVTDRKVVAAERALKDAKKAQETAEDAAYAQSVVDNAEQALRFAQFTYAQTWALQNGGVVRATFEGVLLSCDLAVGKPSTAGNSGLEIALGAPRFSMKLDAKSAERVSIGSEVTLYREGKPENAPLKVDSISMPDADNQVTVKCSGAGEGEHAIGAEQEWDMRKKSNQYDSCIPIEALRQGGPDEYYVFVLEEKDTILGKQLAVKRVDVDLLAHDAKRAAISGGLEEDDKLATTSSKEITDGDLVVLYEG